MKSPIIVFDHVSKSFPLYHHMAVGFKNCLIRLPKTIEMLRSSRHLVLEDVSFTVFRGETVGIIGRNGSGKSTTLGLIAKVIYPTEGKVWVGDRISPMLELGGGFHPELSGIENIILNGVLLGCRRLEVMRKLNNIVLFSGLEAFIDQPIRTYSTGMLARLGFSILAYLDPRLLLVDEVLAVGDLEFQKKCLTRMEEFKAAGVTTIFVSHSLSDVQRICDRVVWIDNHRIRKVGTPEEVLGAYSGSVSSPIS